MYGTVLFKTYGRKDESFELDNWIEWPDEYKDRWPNFQPHEFRCKDGSAYMVIQTELLDALQELRGKLKRPIHINSGFRTVKYNTKVGGKPNSQHLLGKAADIVVTGVTTSQLRDFVELIPAFAAGGIGYYPKQGFVHVDVRRTAPTRWTE